MSDSDALTRAAAAASGGGTQTRGARAQRAQLISSSSSINAAAGSGRKRGADDGDAIAVADGSSHNRVNSPAPAVAHLHRALSRDGSQLPNSSASASQSQTHHDVAKKRRTAPGSRGVANLTPDQLAKKRANDREAQRAIRERTKAQIENLERRIQELTSQQPYQELQAALKAKEAVEAENLDIKRRLASMMSLIEPLLHPSQQKAHRPVLPSPGPVQTYLPAHTTPAPASTSTPNSAPSPANSADLYGQWHSRASSISVPAAQGHNQNQNYAKTKMLDQQRHDLAHGLDLGGERLGLDFLLEPSHRITRMSELHGENASGYRNAAGPIKHDMTAAGTSHPSSPYNTSPGQDAALHSNIDPALASYSTPINNSSPSCPLDNLLLDFLQERRQRAVEGLSTQEIIGPRYPNISSLLNPEKESHPLSKVFTDILQTFPDIHRLPERVAVLYIMFLIMRWQIHPSQENYDRLPTWVQPLPIQLFTAHPAWIDHLPFPRMREKIIRDLDPPAGFCIDHFFVPFTTTLNLNWPYEDTDTLLQSPGSDELMINPVFERHLRRLENWTLGDAFAKTFPVLDGTYNFRPERR